MPFEYPKPIKVEPGECHVLCDYQASARHSKDCRPTRATRNQTQTEEVRITSATGGEKGQKLAQLGGVDPAAILELARVAGHGAEKYDRYNYLRGYDWSLSFDALMRHALAFWNGEDRDPESGEYHMAHAAWHGLALVSFLLRGIGTDNRPPKVGE